MNLAYKYPIIFWNCACLIANSGGAEIEEDEYYEEENRGTDRDDSILVSMEDFTDNDEDEEDETDVDDLTTGKDKKARTANFGKIATAIGKMKAVGIGIAPPDINSSGFTFTPDAKENVIRYGLSGITRVGEEIIHNIIDNRPYASVDDFLTKVKVNKPQMVNLIKAGAFDKFGDSRNQVMDKYIRSISDQKKRITLQNMSMLINFGMIPNEYDFHRRVFNFNKYIKKFKTEDGLYMLDEIALSFFENVMSIDDTIIKDGIFYVHQAIWDKEYKTIMEQIKTKYLKPNHDLILNNLNNKLIEEKWNKYCLGTISKWEMDAVSCYFHSHELENAPLWKYGIEDFFDMSENPEIERVISIKGKEVPLYRITRIAGTVLDKDKAKKTVTLLTTSGVVTVKIYGDVFTQYDKQISEKGADGKKHIIQKSWFSRGNKIIVTGMRQEDTFLAKKYSRTPYHLVELIEEINDNGLVIQSERPGEVE